MSCFTISINQTILLISIRMSLYPALSLCVETGQLRITLVCPTVLMHSHFQFRFKARLLKHGSTVCINSLVAYLLCTNNHVVLGFQVHTLGWFYFQALWIYFAVKWLNILPRVKIGHIWGQSYKTFYTFGQIYKLVLKLDNMLW